MVPDYVWISNFHLHSLIIANIAETYCVPLCEGRQNVFFKCSCTAEINLCLPASHFVHCEAVVFFLQSLLCVLEGLEDQLLLPLGLHAGQLWEVAGGTGQPPQELCIITRWKETADVTASGRRKQERAALLALSQKSLDLRLEGFLFFFVTV